MKTWHEVMKVQKARALVKGVREGQALTTAPWWRDAIETAPVRVAVIDNGCDVGHPALPAPSQTYNFAGAQSVFVGANPQAMLNNQNSHGTMSAAMIVGKPDQGAGFLGGVAADIAGVQFCPARYDPAVDFNRDKTMYARVVSDGAHVVTNSYGLELTGNQRAQLDKLFKEASAVFVFAAGNSNAELAVTKIFYNTILVSASVPGDTLNDEVKVPKSNYGAGIIVCAPGGGAGLEEPVSPVNRGTGLNGGNYDTYSDTSAACAMVAGVITLMLLAKPNLGPQRIKEILALTADKIDPACGGAGQWRKAAAVLNGMQKEALPETLWNRDYSKFYGFGRVNAKAAVTMALT